MASRARKPKAGDESVHHVSQRQKRARPKPSMQPPLTPMIDVTFQLLLFFILTMEFRRAEGQLPADLPKQDGPQAAATVKLEEINIRLRVGGTTPEAPPIIEIERFGQATINNWSELRDVLEDLKKRFDSDETPVVVKPQGRVRWADVVNAYNQARVAGYKVVGFAPAEE